jgi:putative Holliday junction resolvase
MAALLALDVGDARIGLARAEAGSSFAFGRGYLRRQGLRRDVAAVKARAEEEGAELVVVGLPRSLSGGDSAQTRRVRAFAGTLEAAGLTVAFEDERLTSRLAGQDLLKSGKGKKKRQEKGLLDEGAAVRILETYLARQAHQAQAHQAQTHQAKAHQAKAHQAKADEG